MCLVLIVACLEWDVEIFINLFLCLCREKCCTKGGKWDQINKFW